MQRGLSKHLPASIPSVDEREKGEIIFKLQEREQSEVEMKSIKT